MKGEKGEEIFLSMSDFFVFLRISLSPLRATGARKRKTLGAFTLGGGGERGRKEKERRVGF